MQNWTIILNLLKIVIQLVFKDDEFFVPFLYKRLQYSSHTRSNRFPPSVLSGIIMCILLPLKLAIVNLSCRCVERQWTAHTHLPHIVRHCATGKVLCYYQYEDVTVYRQYSPRFGLLFVNLIQKNSFMYKNIALTYD